MKELLWILWQIENDILAGFFFDFMGANLCSIGILKIPINVLSDGLQSQK
jgi:hypothetical protein